MCIFVNYDVTYEIKARLRQVAPKLTKPAEKSRVKVLGLGYVVPNLNLITVLNIFGLERSYGTSKN
jgi:hypothetical protein